MFTHFLYLTRLKTRQEHSNVVTTYLPVFQKELPESFGKNIDKNVPTKNVG